MPAARPSNAAADPAPPSFESAMERLEAVVEQMENSKLPLEELIRCYEEGTQLIKVCSERLSAAEQRIEIITRDAAGQPAERTQAGEPAGGHRAPLLVRWFRHRGVQPPAGRIGPLEHHETTPNRSHRACRSAVLVSGR